MMILMFSVGGDNYGINVRDVTEVLPNVALKRFPNGPEHVAGLLNYRGQLVPVVDLTLLMAAQASRKRISSRIVLVNYHDDHQPQHLLGLLLERITETVRIPDHAFTKSRVITNDTPFLGDIAIHNEVMIQVIDIKRVLPESVKALLFYDDGNKNAVVSNMKD